LCGHSPLPVFSSSLFVACTFTDVYTSLFSFFLLWPALLCLIVRCLISCIRLLLLLWEYIYFSFNMLIFFTKTLLINSFFSSNFFLTATFSQSSVLIVLPLNQLSSSFTLVNFIIISSSVTHSGIRNSSLLSFIDVI
jgi:hypothetical protein